MVDDNSVLDCLVVKKGAAALTGGTLKAMQKELELADEKVKHTPCTTWNILILTIHYTGLCICQDQ